MNILSLYLWLLDGYDETSRVFQEGEVGDFKALLTSKWLQESCVIVTTRPHKVATFIRKYKFRTNIELAGFTEGYFLIFMSRFFEVSEDSMAWLIGDSDDHEIDFSMLADDMSVDEVPGFCTLMNILTTLAAAPHLIELCKFPIIATLICQMWKDCKEIPNGKTGLYKALFVHYAKHMQAKQDEELDEDMISQWVDEILLKLGRIALDGLLEDKLVFKASEINPDLLTTACDIGITTKERVRSKTSAVQHFTFIHKIFQEMCAAVYWVSLDKQEFDGYLRRIDGNNIEDMEYLLRFCCGVRSRTALYILPLIIELTMSTIATKFSDICNFLNLGDSNANPWRLPLMMLFEAESQGVKILKSSDREHLTDMVKPLFSQMRVQIGQFVDYDLETFSVLEFFTDLCEKSQEFVQTCWLSAVNCFVVEIEDESLHAVTIMNLIPHMSQLSVLNVSCNHDVLATLFDKLCNCPNSSRKLKEVSCQGDLSLFDFPLSLELLTKQPNLSSMSLSQFGSEIDNRFVLQGFHHQHDEVQSEGCLKEFHCENTACPVDFLILQSKLSVLRLSRNNLNEVDTDLILSVLQSAPIQVLQVDDNEVGKSSIFILPLVPILKELSLSNAQMGTECWKVLLGAFEDAGRQQDSEMNDQKQNQGGDQEERKHLPLTKLDISRNYIDDESVHVGAALSKLQNLQELNLSGNIIGSINDDLCRGLYHLRALKWLDLSETYLTTDGVRRLPLSSLSSLQHLDLSDNTVGESFEDLCKQLHHLQNLCWLKLSNMGLNDKCAMNFSSTHLPKLTHLDMSKNAISPEGVYVLARSLKRLKALVHLNMEVDTQRTSQGLDALFRNIGHCPKLHTLVLPEFDFSPDSCSALLKACLEKIAECLREMSKGDWSLDDPSRSESDLESPSPTPSPASCKSLVYCCWSMVLDSSQIRGLVELVDNYEEPEIWV